MNVNMDENDVIHGSQLENSDIYEMNPDEISLATDSQISTNKDKKLVNKDRPLIDDIQSNLFVLTEDISSGKRKGKLRKLQIESIDYDIYATNKCVFLTQRPLLWAQALEKYIDITSDTSCRWSYKVENNLFVECELYLFYSNTKKVIVNIHVKTGVILIQGQYHKEWSNDIFEILKDFVNGKEEHVTPISNNAEQSVPQDYEMLWEENNSLKSAIKCLEKTVGDLRKDIIDSNNRINQQKHEFETKLTDMEKKFDSKLTVFMSATATDCEKKVAEKIKAINNVIVYQKQQLSKMESRLQKSIATNINTKPNNCTCLPKEDTSEASVSKISNDQILQKEKIAIMEIKIASLESQLPTIRTELINQIPSVDFEKIKESVKLVDAKIDSMRTNVTDIHAKDMNKMKEEQKIVVTNLSTIKAKVESINKKLQITTNENSAATGSNIDNNENATNRYTTKLLICMDSNRKFLEPRKLWSLQGTTWKFCPRINSVNELIDKKLVNLNEVETILISCGVNDIDYYPGIDVHKYLMDTISKIKASNPDIYIIISELTPRKDVKDSEVITCNRMMNDSVKSLRNVTLIKHDNLRDDEHTH